MVSNFYGPGRSGWRQSAWTVFRFIRLYFPANKACVSYKLNKATQKEKNKINNETRRSQGRNVGERGTQFPGRRITAGGAEKSQQCHKYCLQYSTVASERPQARTWGRQTCFLPRAPSNLVTPLVETNKTDWKQRRQRCTAHISTILKTSGWRQQDPPNLKCWNKRHTTWCNAQVRIS